LNDETNEGENPIRRKPSATALESMQWKYPP